MRTTQRLLRRLYRSLSRDPEPFLAMRLGYAGKGSMRWTVQDGRLSTTVTDGVAVNLQIQSVAPNNAAFSIGGNTVSIGAVAAPDGTTTARRLRSGTSGPSSVWLGRSATLPVTAGVTYTFGTHARLNAGAAAVGNLLIIEPRNAAGASMGQSVGPAASLVTSAWQRFSRSWTAPAGCVAVQVYYAGNWTVGAELDLWGFSINPGATLDPFLVTTTATATQPPEELDLALDGLTLAGLAGQIAGSSSYTVSDLSAEHAGLSAMTLLDASGNPAASNGDHLFGYRSLLWALLEACAVHLDRARAQIGIAPAEMAVSTADGEWLDELGQQYGIPRVPGETDSSYAPRLIAEVVMPRDNNIALELAIQAMTGHEVVCTDATIYGSAVPVHDGSITHNGAFSYNSSAKPLYGMFDISTVYDSTTGLNVAELESAIRALVNRRRAVGTQLRQLTLTSAAGGLRYNGMRSYNGANTHNGS